jgi:hypothetical protein
MSAAMHSNSSPEIIKLLNAAGAEE